MGRDIAPELREMMRQRVIRYEEDLYSCQSDCFPTQLIDRDHSPLRFGNYTDEQIDRIIFLEREEAAKVADLEISADAILSRAIQRCILG